VPRDALRRPKDGEHSVADELVDVTTVAGDDRDDALKELIEARHHLGGRGFGRRRGEVADVAEHQRDLDLLAVRFEVLADQVLGDLLVEVGAERLP
jgi:hypothetical protein